MQRLKIANVVFENSEQGLRHPGLYCKADAPLLFDGEQDQWNLLGPGTYDFTTYFNSLSLRKFREYTNLTNFHLHLEIKGAPAVVKATYANALTQNDIPRVHEKPMAELGEVDIWYVVDVELPWTDEDVVIGFELITQGKTELRHCYYYSEVEEEQLHPVELVLSTTTFKKENYILRNLAQLKTEILNGEEPMAEHFWVQVVDNGRTLDAGALEQPHLRIIPNENVGGTGGYSRGMIEAMEQTPAATHILLMDDDVAISTESIKRTYVLLQALNETYEKAFVSGAMFDYEIGSDQFEDLGYMAEDGHCGPVKPPLHMSLLRDVVYNEVFIAPACTEEHTYAGWWYCCIPMATIKREGLPLPVFVRYDDIEYAIRCNPRFITMNGICIWHMGFQSRYSAAVERYQTTRNSMVSRMTTNMAPKSNIMQEFRHNLMLELKKYNYDNAELALKGFEDFMKGPSFFEQPIGEERFIAANKEAERLYPLDELQKLIDDDPQINEPINVSELTAQLVDDAPKRTISQRAFDYLTFNGQRSNFARYLKGNVAIISYFGWVYPGGKLHGCDTLIVIDTYNQRGAIRHLDKQRFQKVMARYHHDIAAYSRNKAKLKEEYSAAREKLTSVEFWKHYLGMDS